MAAQLGILRMKLWLHSQGPVDEFTGKVSKTVLIKLVPEAQLLFERVKGFYKPLSITPPINPHDGMGAYFSANSKDREPDQSPPVLEGEYEVRVGGRRGVVEQLAREVEGSPHREGGFPLKGVGIHYRLLEAQVTPPRMPPLEPGETYTVEVKLASPALLPNPFTADQHVRRYFPTPLNMFWVSYMIHWGLIRQMPLASHDPQALREAIELLEGRMYELWSSRFAIRWVKYNDTFEPTLQGRFKYSLTPQTKEEAQTLQGILRVAKTLGVGAARAAGFGAINLKITKNTHPSQNQKQEP